MSGSFVRHIVTPLGFDVSEIRDDLWTRNGSKILVSVETDGNQVVLYFRNAAPNSTRKWSFWPWFDDLMEHGKHL